VADRSGPHSGTTGPLLISCQRNLNKYGDNNQINFGYQNNCQNQIRLTIACHKDKPDSELDYFLQRKSKYVLLFSLYNATISKLWVHLGIITKTIICLFFVHVCIQLILLGRQNLLYPRCHFPHCRGRNSVLHMTLQYLKVFTNPVAKQVIFCHNSAKAHSALT
jgi:hypothetical protein